MKIKISRFKLDRIRSSLQSLDAGIPGEGGKKTPFKFKNPGKVIYNLAKSSRAIDDVMETLEKTRVTLVERFLAEQRISDPNAKELSGPWMSSFSAEFNKLLLEEEEIDFRQVSLDDLDLETNQISFQVIGVLDGVVIETPKS